MSLIDSWLDRWIRTAPKQFTFMDGLDDPGFAVAGAAMVAEECYVEIYVESLRLKDAKKFGARFDGVVYVFAELAQDGLEAAKLASVTKPAELGNLDANGLDKVIVLQKHMIGPTPWRGGKLDLELGLFSVKKSNVLTPWLDYVTKVADAGGVSFVGQAKPFLSLIGEGMDLLAGQTQDCAIEVAIDTSMRLDSSRICAIIAEESGSIDRSRLSLDKNQRLLLLDGRPLDAGYCVFSIRCTKEKADYGEIPDLRAAMAALKKEILWTDSEAEAKPRAERALSAFRRTALASPDLIDSDRQRLAAKARALFDEAFSGARAVSRGEEGVDPAQLELGALNLYDA